jgi:hypothetical protein
MIAWVKGLLGITQLEERVRVLESLLRAMPIPSQGVKPSAYYATNLCDYGDRIERELGQEWEQRNAR